MSALADVAGLTAKAETQTDARCFLATVSSRVAEVAVNVEERQHRIVANRETLLDWELGEPSNAVDPPSAGEGRHHRVVFWKEDHGIRPGDRVGIRVLARPERALVHVLQGIVAQVEQHEVHLLGRSFHDSDQRHADETLPRSDDRDPT